MLKCTVSRSAEHCFELPHIRAYSAPQLPADCNLSFMLVCRCVCMPYSGPIIASVVPSLALSRLQHNVGAAKIYSSPSHRSSDFYCFDHNPAQCTITARRKNPTRSQSFVRAFSCHISTNDSSSRHMRAALTNSSSASLFHDGANELCGYCMEITLKALVSLLIWHETTLLLRVQKSASVFYPKVQSRSDIIATLFYYLLC